MTSKPIAVIFASVKGNVGDFAILEAIFRELSRVYPLNPIHLYPHGHLDFDPERIDAFRRAGAPAFKIPGRLPKTPMLRGLHRLAGTSIGRVVQSTLIGWFARKKRSQLAAFQDYELVIGTGGAHWNGPHLGLIMFSTLIGLSSNVSRVVTFPFSINPEIFDFHNLTRLRHYFDYIDGPLLVRDSISMEVMSRIGAPARQVPDCVFSLLPIAEKVMPKSKRNTERILVSLTRGQGKTVQASNEIVLQNLSDIEGIGPIELITTSWQEDLAELELLAKRFGVPVRAPLTWQDTVAEFRSSALVITNRLHGLILGAMGGAALLPVCDRKKSEAFTHDAEMPLRAQNPTALTATLIREALFHRDVLVNQAQIFARRSHSAFHSPFTITLKDQQTND